jgi:uncharacterized repeat protein (TIGR03803 family)
MRQKRFWIAAGCVLAVLGLLPAFSSGEAPIGYSIIYSFTGGSDGGNPLSDLTVDAAGNLYGTTQGGGTGGGTVFELKRTKNGWKEEVLYNFGSHQSDGVAPHAGVIFDKAGNLYGTTSGAGANCDCGTVFKLSPNSHGGWTETILYSFTNQNGDGANPQTDLVFDAHGNLYGTAALGGDSSHEACIGYFRTGCGIVFELTPHADGSWTEATIYAFTGVPDGATPSTPVVLDSLGNVYGLTEGGGNGKCLYAITPGCGVAYKLTPSSGGKWTESVIYELDRGRGFAVNPSGGLLFDNVGHLIGTTLAGGNGLGAVFELEQSEKMWKETVLYRFYGNPDGAYPVGQLSTDEKGDLFGVAFWEGAHRFDGMVFELMPGRTQDWKEKILHGFAGGIDGSRPEAGLVSDSQGHLYGTTEQGEVEHGANRAAVRYMRSRCDRANTKVKL